MSNIKVCVKIHPFSQSDTKLKKEEQWRVTENNSLQCMDPVHSCKFTFDHVFGARSPNYEVYLSIVKPIFESCLTGFNGTIITYGSSLAGKNYTMIGTKMDPGILLTTIEQLFIQIGGSPEHTIRFGYIEIYKEKIYDLLNDRQPVLIDQNKKFDFVLSNDEIIVENYEKAVETVLTGSYKRKSSAVDGSKLSNLSHSIFRIAIQSEDKANGKMLISYLRFVHVAGSETISKYSTLDSLQDKSNTSLYWFNAVIDELNRGEKNVNFSNSVLTMLLREPLTGKSNTAIICNIRSDVIDETMPALKFVCQVRNVRTFPMRNEMYTVQSRASCSPVSVHDGQFIDLDHYLKQIANLKIENSLLRNELEEEKAAAAVRKQWFREQMKSAEFAQQKLQHDLMEQKRIRSELELAINHLTNSNPNSNEDQLTDKKTAVDPLRQNGCSSVNIGNENLMRESPNYVDNRPNESLQCSNGIRNLVIQSPEYVDNQPNDSFHNNNEIRSFMLQSPEYVDHRPTTEPFHHNDGTRNFMRESPKYVDNRPNESFHYNDETRNLMLQSPEYVDHRPTTEPLHHNDGNRHLMRGSPEYVENRPNESFHNNYGTRNLMLQSPEYVDNRPTTEPFHHNDGNRHLMRESPEYVDNRPNESFHNNYETRHWTRQSPEYVDNQSTKPFHHNDRTRHSMSGSPKYVNNRPKKAIRHNKGTNVMRRSPNYVNNRPNKSFHYNNGPRNLMSGSPKYVDNRPTSPYLHNDGNTNLMRGSPNYSVNRSFHNERETGNKRKSRADSSESDWSVTSNTQKCEKNDGKAEVGPSPLPFSVCERIRNRDKSETCTLTVRNAIIGRIIGRSGCRLNDIRSETGVSISISARDGESARNVTVNGNSYAVSKAVDMIKERLETDY